MELSSLCTTTNWHDGRNRLRKKYLNWNSGGSSSSKTQLELKWNSNGTQIGLKWDSNGTQMGLKSQWLKFKCYYSPRDFKTNPSNRVDNGGIWFLTFFSLVKFVKLGGPNDVLKCDSRPQMGLKWCSKSYLIGYSNGNHGAQSSDSGHPYSWNWSTIPRSPMYSDICGAQRRGPCRHS